LQKGIYYWFGPPFLSGILDFIWNLGFGY